MTSRISSSTDRRETDRYRGAGFFTRQRELARRRLWPIALTFVGHLLYYVVGLATALQMSLANTAGSHYTAAEKTDLLRMIVSDMLGRHSPSWALITFPLAAILAIEGFAWMDNRQEVDFYESLPVPRRQRFCDICIGSFLYFIFAYVLTLETGLLIAGAMGAVTRALLLEVLQQAACSIAFFLSIYGLGVLSAMLTGNIIIAWLAFAVLLLYETILKEMLAGYCSIFLATWSHHPTELLRCSFSSPLFHYLDRAGVVETPLRLLGLAVLYFLLAWICYCLRRNEAAGTAVVFRPVASVVRIAMAVITGLLPGLFFTLPGIMRGIAIPLVWILLFTVLTACVMQIIYTYDFHALFQHPLEIAAAVLISLLIYLGFHFDVLGYDRYIPDPASVADAAMISTDNYEERWTDEGETITPEEYGGRFMHLDNVEDVIALARFGQEYTRKIKTSDGGEEDRPDEYNFQVQYRMNNGRIIYRNFFLPSTIDPALMDAVIGSPGYREGTFAVYHDDSVLENADNFLLEVTNGTNWTSVELTKDLYQALREAYREDLKQFSYSFAKSNRPFLRISIEYHDVRSRDTDPHPEFENMNFNYPVYPSFRRTIQVLQGAGAWLEPYDYSLLPDYDNYDSLSREEQALLDKLELSVFCGPFHYNVDD